MATRLIIDGNAVYEIDEDCMECREKRLEARDRLCQQGKKQGGKKKRSPGNQ